MRSKGDTAELLDRAHLWKLGDGVNLSSMWKMKASRAQKQCCRGAFSAEEGVERMSELKDGEKGCDMQSGQETVVTIRKPQQMLVFSLGLHRNGPVKNQAWMEEDGG